MSRGRAAVGPCALCERELPLTFHHLIPRTLHTNRWFQARYSREEMAAGIDVCRDCHSAIHRFIDDEKELARSFATVERLLAHETLGRHVAWLRTQRSGRNRVRSPRTV